MESEGICEYCKNNFSGNVMAKHLQGCIERKEQIEEDNTDGKIFLIKAECKPYWVYFEANSDSKLKDIDSFLRDLWLECCGHLSLFTIGENTYASDPEPGDGDKSMKIGLGKVLYVGTVFMHEYDFGTTTTLGLKVIGERNGKIEDIDIVARNNPPDIKCECGNPAKEICTECVEEGKGFLCENCAKEHECGEEMLLPVINSPRTGMCGYTGN